MIDRILIFFPLYVSHYYTGNKKKWWKKVDEVAKDNRNGKSFNYNNEVIVYFKHNVNIKNPPDKI